MRADEVVDMTPLSVQKLDTMRLMVRRSCYFRRNSRRQMGIKAAGESLLLKEKRRGSGNPGDSGGR
jgi:hypothetical protein